MHSYRSAGPTCCFRRRLGLCSKGHPRAWVHACAVCMCNANTVGCVAMFLWILARENIWFTTIMVCSNFLM